MPLRPSFIRMRQRLIDRGLLDAEFRLTDAGNTHVDRLIERLKRAESTAGPKHTVFWNVDFRAKGAELAQRRAA